MRLLSPEAEATRSLYSGNLVKWGTANLQQEEKRIIDAAELLLKRGEISVSPHQQAGSPAGSADGFSEGLHAAELDLASGDGISGNVIKAGEDAEALRARAQEEADALIADAHAQSESILAQALAEAEAEKEKVFAQARQQGYEEGMGQARQEAEQTRQELDARAQALEEDYRRQLESIEPELVEAITGAYQHIFNVRLSSYKKILFYLISSTMRKAEGSREFLVHVSKADYPKVLEQREHLGEGMISSNASVEVIEDPSLAENECMIETEGGIFDCGLGTQLAELRNRLRLLAYDGT